MSASVNIGLATAPITPMEIAIARPNDTATARSLIAPPLNTIAPGPASITSAVPTNSVTTFRAIG